MSNHRPAHGLTILATTILLSLPLALSAQRAPAAAQSRQVIVNGVRLSDADLTGFEQRYHTQILDGDYWYDKVSGAWGQHGGPAVGLILPGLDLGGPLAADASGNARTGVFVNGRQLHPMDVAALQQITPVYPGRYWVDGMGNVGLEGGPVLANLWALAKARNASRGGGSSTWYSKDGSSMVGSDGNGCVVFNDIDSHTSATTSGC